MIIMQIYNLIKLSLLIPGTFFAVLTDGNLTYSPLQEYPFQSEYKEFPIINIKPEQKNFLNIKHYAIQSKLDSKKFFIFENCKHNIPPSFIRDVAKRAKKENRLYPVVVLKNGSFAILN